MNYESKPDAAQEQFWRKVMEDMKNSTSKKIYLEVQEIQKFLAKKSKIDGWKFLRGLAADVVGKIDKLGGS
jgi:hypothetical protein